MSFNYPDLRDRERTFIKEKVKSRDKYTCSEFPCNPVKKTDPDSVQLVLQELHDYTSLQLKIK